MTTNRAILLVEDDENDVFLMKRALREAGVTNPLFIVEDGQEAIDYLGLAKTATDPEKYPMPAVVFLDINLPLRTGVEVLAWIRQRPEFVSLVVIMLTSSNEPTDLKKSYALGANSYLVKPPDSEKLLDLAKSFKWYWLEYNRFKEPLQPDPG